MDWKSFFRPPHSVHIAGHGVGQFYFSEGHLKAIQFLEQAQNVDHKWVRHTTKIIEGVAGIPFLHLDIRTPFGESADEDLVNKALEEALGPKKDNYILRAWHILFVEDSHLGSNHRVFAELKKSKKDTEILSADVSIPMEIGLEAIGEEIAAQTKCLHFQLVYELDTMLYSWIFHNGAPYHLLCLNITLEADLVQRLLAHRQFLVGQEKNGNLILKSFALNQVNKQSEPVKNWAKAMDSVEIWQGPVAYANLLHYGLASVLKNPALQEHARPQKAHTFTLIRNRFFAGQMLLATFIFCLVILSIMGIYFNGIKREHHKLMAVADTHALQIKNISHYRLEKIQLESKALELKPVWKSGYAWKIILQSIANALPEHSGLEGLMVTQTPTGGSDLSFRAWVKDWNAIRGIQTKLEKIPEFKSVSLTDQKRDLASGLVIFHVNCLLEKP